MYPKAVRSYFEAVFLPDEEDKKDSEKSTFFKRYAYYTIEDLMIVDDATGRYIRYSMPRPFRWPGRFGWWLLYIWQTKIVKTHI
jgi:hypothetical protein